MSSGQVCRPHFHAPLHPWLPDSTKSLSHGGWFQVAGGGGDPDKSQSPSSAPGQPHNLFSFPPTPPKDSTPDSVAPSAGAEYQAAVAAMGAAFMHGGDNGQSCALDVKPSAVGASSNKQREGSEYEGAQAACLMVTLKARTGLRMATVFTGRRTRRRINRWGLPDKARSRLISPGINRERVRVRLFLFGKQDWLRVHFL